MSEELEMARRHRAYAEVLRKIAAATKSRADGESLIRFAEEYERLAGAKEATARFKEAMRQAFADYDAQDPDFGAGVPAAI